MSYEEFIASLDAPAPPDAPELLAALWWDAKGDWDRAHEIAQSEGDRGRNKAAAAWVHAYLHRKEGDRGNASYWYRQAGKPVSSLPLEREWREIAEALAGKLH